MKSYSNWLENLNVFFDKNLAVDRVVGSLPSYYDNFIMTYHLNNMEKTLMNLYNLLQTAEFRVKTIHGTPQSQVFDIQIGGGKKKKHSYPKWKGKV